MEFEHISRETIQLEDDHRGTTSSSRRRVQHVSELADAQTCVRRERGVRGKFVEVDDMRFGLARAGVLSTMLDRVLRRSIFSLSLKSLQAGQVVVVSAFSDDDDEMGERDVIHDDANAGCVKVKANVESLDRFRVLCGVAA